MEEACSEEDRIMKKSYLVAAAILLCVLTGCSKHSDRGTETAATGRNVKLVEHFRRLTLNN